MEDPENSENCISKEDNPPKSEASFKKPILIGKIGRLPRKVPQPVNNSDSVKKPTTENVGEIKHVSEETKESNVLIGPTKEGVPSGLILPYREPPWSGMPDSAGKQYSFEVLKNGSIIETINLMSRPFWVFGRLENCNILMQHPTISRYHAVLQYRNEPTEKEEPGFYIYDLGSTHGTFLNKSRLKSKIYVRIQVGHMLRLGCSTRSYILNGPDEDAEEESELTVTELKQKRAEEIKKREEKMKEAELKAQKEEEDRRKKEEERGVDWGLGEDAEEETDLSENPFAQTTNEELYLDDPKKALRGFFEREGLNLEYDCNEQGMGQFLCKVELPIDDERGRPIIAEVLHKGKKKEAVVQCALEACRIIDRYGLLRQATHESRKRKAKNWEENDYYDSDDDTFLDRTGTVEKKREMRMKAKAPPKAETYESLLEKEKDISQTIVNIEKQLFEAQALMNSAGSSNPDDDSLDSFMKNLKQTKPDKQTVSKLKLELTKLKQEHANIIRLVNIARPASLPPLVPQYSSEAGTSNTAKRKALPLFGKRLKVKVQLPPKPASTEVSNTKMDVEVEEEEEEEEMETNENIGTKENNTNSEFVENTSDGGNERITTVCNNSEETSDNSSVSRNELEDIDESSSSSDDDGERDNISDYNTIKSFHNTMTFKKFEKILKKGLPPFADKHQDKLEKILNNLKKLAANEDRMHVDWKILAAKKRKVVKLLQDLKNCEPNEKLEHKVSSELNRILNELNTMTEEKYKVIGKVKKMGNKIKNISEEIDKDFKHYQECFSNKNDKEGGEDSVRKSPVEGTSNMTNPVEDVELPTNSAVIEKSEPSTSSNRNHSNSISEDSEEQDERKKKKNQRRIHQRQEKAELERQRGYEEDATREDYSMWVPPTNQTGDGRTTLNDKFGY